VTYAFFPDETHKSIRRTFFSSGRSETQRQFCGYCGTQLSSWNEQTSDDAGHINVNLGSLEEDDVALLDSWGLLAPEDEEEENAGQGGPVAEAGASSSLAPRSAANTVQVVAQRGAPWFEEMVEHSRLGQLRRQRGGYESHDGSTTVQWEVVELRSDGTEVALDENLSTGKRKRGDSDDPGKADVQMRG
jgi:hypothetical protein